MSGGFGIGVIPQQVGAAMQQAPPTDLHTDPLPLRSDPPRTYTPRPVDTNVEHSSTATNLALAEALQRIQNGERTGEYQQPKSPLALMQMKRAGLSDAEILILQHSTGQPAPRDATGNIVLSGTRGVGPDIPPWDSRNPEGADQLYQTYQADRTKIGLGFTPSNRFGNGT